MPTLAEKLNPQSSEGQISAAISDSISQLISEGRSQNQATAIAHEQARKSTRKPLDRSA